MLLTVGNPKTAKGEARGYLTAVLHLAPANVAGMGTVCAKATAGCMATCLNTAGRGGMWSKATGQPTASAQSIQDARKRRTAFFKLDRTGFEAALARDIESLERKAKRMGLTLVVRVNGTSDLRALALSMAQRFPHIQFYDYTKLAPARWSDWRAYPANYNLTFSRSESNAAEVRSAVANGFNVAVVFATRRSKALPETWLGQRVIDGDKHDLRFLDPHGVIVGLRAKGRARKDSSGFVVNV